MLEFILLIFEELFYKPKGHPPQSHLPYPIK